MGTTPTARPLARSTDPATSHAAAQVATTSNARGAVLHILRTCGPLHDAGIQDRHDTLVAHGVMPRRSGQRLRTARAGLVDEGLVRQQQSNGAPVTVRLPSGCQSMVWELAQ